MTTPRENHLVELVDEEGLPIGSATVDDAHRAPGRLHRAFSVFLRDPAGRVLVQQRAAVKTRFPLRWANTCCGHPEPGEELATSAARRLVEEIGIGGVSLTEVGVYSYYAEDPATGRVEYEYDHVLLGDLPSSRPVLADADEVAGVRWVPLPELRAELTADPRAYAPWLAGVTERLEAYLSALPGPAKHVPGARPASDSLPDASLADGSVAGGSHAGGSASGGSASGGDARPGGGSLSGGDALPGGDAGDQGEHGGR